VVKRTLLLVLLLIPGVLWGDVSRDKPLGRIDSAAAVLKEIMEAPDAGIPEEILNSSKCIAVVPSMLNAAFVFGGNYGKGVASCRTEHGWSAPAFFNLKGGSFGFQVGGQAVDLIMVIMNEQGMQHLLSSKFELGAGASGAAGPVGRHVEGGTDWKLRAQVLTYSRARGVFAGVSLKGAVLTQNKDDTRAFYGRMIPFRTLLTGLAAATADSQPFLGELNKYNQTGAAGGK